MPYSRTDIDDTKTAKVYGKNIDISPKHSREICHTIKGMRSKEQRNYWKAQ